MSQGTPKPIFVRQVKITPTKEIREEKKEIKEDAEKKLKPCTYPNFECTIPCLDGYDYCMRHILRDTRAPFRQCTFIYSNNKKCLNAVPKYDTKKDPPLTTLCFEHNRQNLLQKTQEAIGRFRRIESNEVLLQSLAHHLNVKEPPPEVKQAVDSEQDEEIDVVFPYVAPFVAHEHINDLSEITATIKKKRRILDYASDSSSNEEQPTMVNTSRGYECNESDDESVDSAEEDVLKHATHYTCQEVVRITENKLTKLRSLYVNQVHRLNHLLRERRRRYLHAIRREREVACSIHTQPKETLRERTLYAQFKALNSYHRRHGVEAVLHRKFKEKRALTHDMLSHRGPGFAKCVYTEGGVKCSERTLPGYCKYCRKHILEDKKQTLYRACGVEKSGVVCKEPVPWIFDDSTCVLHLVIPPKRQYVQRKCESETEEEIDIKREPLQEPIEQPKEEPQEEGEQLSMSTDVVLTKPNETNELNVSDAASAESINVTIAHEAKTTEEVVVMQ